MLVADPQIPGPQLSCRLALRLSQIPVALGTVVCSQEGTAALGWNTPCSAPGAGSELLLVLEEGWLERQQEFPTLGDEDGVCDVGEAISTALPSVLLDPPSCCCPPLLCHWQLKLCAAGLV